jgi:hypothetical protein
MRNVSRPRILAPLQKTGLTARHSPAKKTADLVAPLKEERGRVNWSYAVALAATCPMKVVPHKGIHKNFFGRNDDEAISYYHAETR